MADIRKLYNEISSPKGKRVKKAALVEHAKPLTLMEKYEFAKDKVLKENAENKELKEGPEGSDYTRIVSTSDKDTIDKESLLNRICSLSFNDISDRLDKLEGVMMELYDTHPEIVEEFDLSCNGLEFTYFGLVADAGVVDLLWNQGEDDIDANSFVISVDTTYGQGVICLNSEYDHLLSGEEANINGWDYYDIVDKTSKTELENLYDYFYSPDFKKDCNNVIRKAYKKIDDILGKHDLVVESLKEELDSGDVDYDKLVVDLADRVENPKDEDSVWKALDEGLVYNDDRRTVIEHYFSLSDIEEALGEKLDTVWVALFEDVAAKALEKVECDNQPKGTTELTERNWEITLDSGKELRTAMIQDDEYDEPNYETIANLLVNVYTEAINKLKEAGKNDEAEDFQKELNDFKVEIFDNGESGALVDENDDVLEDCINYYLKALYDYCDAYNIFVAL